VNFLRNVGRILRARDASIPDLDADPRIAFFWLAGTNLKHWVHENNLRELRIPEAHLYDRGTDNPPHYEEEAASVNRRGDRSFAVLTGKREIENYLHPDAVLEEYEQFGIQVGFGDMDSVPEIVAAAVHNAARLEGNAEWNALTSLEKGRKMSAVKRRLNEGAAKRMTVDRLLASDPNGEISAWLRRLGELCENH
jgi:hypothetical protein